MLATYGFTTDSYLESAAFDHAANALFQYQIANGDNYKQVKDGAKTYYNNNKDAYKEHCVQVKHILIPFNGDVAPEETLKKAQNIANLATTSNFDTLLAENNNDPGQPETGYFVKKNSNFVPEFEATALSLKKGEISSPVRTAYGYHILYATEVYTHIPYEEFVNTYLDTNYNTLFLSEIEGWIREAEVVFVEENFLNILE